MTSCCIRIVHIIFGGLLDIRSSCACAAVIADTAVLTAFVGHFCRVRATRALSTSLATQKKSTVALEKPLVSTKTVCQMGAIDTKYRVAGLFFRFQSRGSVGAGSSIYGDSHGEYASESRESMATAGEKIGPTLRCLMRALLVFISFRPSRSETVDWH